RRQPKHEVLRKALPISRDSPIEVGSCNSVEGGNVNVEDDANIPDEADLCGCERFGSVVVTKLFTHTLIINNAGRKSKRSDAHGHNDVAVAIAFVGEGAHLSCGLFVFQLDADRAFGGGAEKIQHV